MRGTSPEFERVRAMCLALPEVSERLSHGESCFFIRGKKSFLSFADRHHDDRQGVWCAAPRGAQEALLETGRECYFRPPYVGHRGWVGIYVDRELDWDEIAGIVEGAHRQVAPSDLLKLVDIAKS